MLYQIKSYLSFLLKSSNEHGVHSPFVFDLVTKCFYAKTNLSKITRFKNIQKKLYHHNKIISVTDFGSGSKVFKSNERAVNKIAKIAGISSKKAALLIRVIDYFNPKNILELGTSVGLGTSAMRIAGETAEITTLEGCKNSANEAKNLFNAFHLNSINIITGNINDTLPTIVNTGKLDLIYVDANHQKEAAIHYFEICLTAADNDSVFIFDDIYYSKEMQEAWNSIKNHSKVTVTVDTFFWGFVFFRKEQAKQHFKIRV